MSLVTSDKLRNVTEYYIKVHITIPAGMETIKSVTVRRPPIKEEFSGATYRLSPPIGWCLVNVQIKDLVTCFPCPLWPDDIRKEFSERAARCHWPPASTLSEIISGGCHVVPVSYRTSTQRDLDFRLSFSVPEIALSRLLSVEHRRAYYFLKVCSLRDFDFSLALGLRW